MSIENARKAAEQQNPRLPYHTGAYDDTWEVTAAAVKPATPSPSTTEQR